MVATSDKAFHADGPLDTSSPLYVVGARTGHAAEARGWRLASPPARDADELIATLAGALKPEARVLYLAGRDRKEVIEAALAGTFELRSRRSLCGGSRARLGARPKRVLSRLASPPCIIRAGRPSSRRRWRRQPGVEACFLKLNHVCMSRDVAEPLQAIGASARRDCRNA